MNKISQFFLLKHGNFIFGLNIHAPETMKQIVRTNHFKDRKTTIASSLYTLMNLSRVSNPQKISFN